MPVFASGYLHPSDTKALAMLGLGRDAGEAHCGREPRAGWTSTALERELKALATAPRPS